MQEYSLPSNERYLSPDHLEEFVKGSCIDRELAEANAYSIEADAALDLLLGEVKRWNSGRVSQTYFNQHANSLSYGKGGWASHTIDYANRRLSDWGCVKPNIPRTDADGKTIKYEHPQGTPQGLFFAHITPAIAKKIAKKNGVQLPEELNPLNVEIYFPEDESWGAVAEEYEPTPYKGFAERDIERLSILEYSLRFYDWAFWVGIKKIFITEGLKKTLALLSKGYLTIGISGVYGLYRSTSPGFGSKQRELVPAVKDLLKNKEVYICFDADNKQKSIRAVNAARAVTGRLLQDNKNDVFVMEWSSHQTTTTGHEEIAKGIDDYTKIKGEAGLDKLVEEAKPFRKWELSLGKKLTFPAVEINQRYLTVQKVDADGNPVIGEDGKPVLEIDPKVKEVLKKAIATLLSHKGSGKSEVEALHVKPILESGSNRILAIGSRINTLKDICARLGIPYISESDNDLSRYHVGLCIDSLHADGQGKFNHEDWKGAIVFLVEVKQLINHVIHSNTCKDKRVKILNNLKQLLNFVLRTGGQIILDDADVNDTVIEFIRDLLDDELKESFNDNLGIIKNNYKFDEKSRWRVYTYKEKNPGKLFKNAKLAIAAGKRILFCLSGQRANSVWGTKVVERKLKKDFPNLKILRVDSETVGNKEHEAFGIMESGKLFLEIAKNYDVVLLSPTGETGIDLNGDCFDVVFGIFSGVQITDAVRQHLARVRANIDRHIWIKNKGLSSSRIGNGSNNPLILSRCERIRNGQTRQQLKNFGITENEDGVIISFGLNYWARTGALINEGFHNYKSEILSDLENEGHLILNTAEIDEDELKAIVVAQKLTRDEVYSEKVEAVAGSIQVSEERFEELKKQPGKTEEEINIYERGLLERLYCTKEVTPALIRKHDDGWYYEILLHFLLLKKEDVLIEREMRIQEKGKDHGGAMIQDKNASSQINRIKILEYLKFEQLLNTDGLHERHPLAVEIGEKGRSRMGLFRDLGINLQDSKKDKPSNMDIVRKLLRLIGFKLPQLGQVSVDNARVRIHGLPAPDFEYEVVSKHSGTGTKEKLKLKLENGRPIPKPDGREEIFEAWTLKAEIDRQKDKERKEQEERLNVAAQLAKQLEEATASGDSNKMASLLLAMDNLKIQPTTGFGDLTVEQVAWNNKLNQLQNKALNQAQPQSQPELQTQSQPALRGEQLRLKVSVVNPVESNLDAQNAKTKANQYIEQLKTLQASNDSDRIAAVLDALDLEPLAVSARVKRAFTFQAYQELKAYRAS